MYAESPTDRSILRVTRSGAGGSGELADATYDLVQEKLRAAEVELTELAKLAELVDHPRGVQHKLSEKLSLALLQQPRSGMTKKQKQRLDSCGREGGAWVTCVPKTAEQQMSRADFRQRIFARLGM